MIVELDEQNFEENTNKGLKLVEFYTTWCMYCKKQRIELEEQKILIFGLELLTEKSHLI